MAFYLVRAKPKKERLETLKEELNSDKVSRMRPFGKALQYSLEKARIDVENRDYVLCLDSGGRTDQKCLQRSHRDLDKNSFESQDPNTAFIIRNIEDKMQYGEKPLGDTNEWHQNKFSI